MFKRLTVILLTVIMMLSLASCGVKKSVDEKIAEKVTEGIVNKATGGEADLNIKDGQLTMKGEDGETVTFGDTKWPEGQAADLLPKFKKGKIITVINADKACMVTLENVEPQDYKYYVEELKSKGFSNDIQEFSSELNDNYSAKSNDSTIVYVLYDSENKYVTINLEISE
ncbi:MAG: hypothetical protein PHD40_00615 [Syntrophomonadaceae bacterium]|nr:hypothetical protein [Syntrophomonadaceae bacterium]